MAAFKAPKKKKFYGDDTSFKPLPIPIASITNEPASSARWSYFDGKLEEDHVTVSLRGDAHALYSKGFFGKIIDARTKEMISMDVDTAEQPKHETSQSESDTKSCDHLHDGQSYDQTTDSRSHDAILTIETNPIEKPSAEIGGNNHELLYLSFEESFFLSFAIGCLFIEHNGGKIGISEQWRIYCDKNPRFPVTYAAHHHFRCKGWVPRDGIRYGADLVVYRKGPPYYHASYVVVIQSVDVDTLELKPFNGVDNREFSWATLSGLLRLATTVSKEIMFCSVLIPSGLSVDQSTPKCVEQFKIRETIASRWASTKDRERELFDIDCEF